jgi:EamA domain-containing membrane protein RarD
MPWLAVLLGLGAAAIFAVGAVAQQQEASNLATSGSQFVRDLLRRPRWWAATFGDACGYGMQAAGLAVGSLLIVQPLLIMALVFALPLSARWNARPIHRRDLVWAVVLALALAGFLFLGNPDGGRDVSRFRAWAPSLVGCGVIVAVGLAMATTGRARIRALGLAITAGTMFGLASALTKSMMRLFGEGLGTALTAWETYALVGVGLVGVVAQQLEISLPAATVLDPVVSVLVGMSALDERLQADGLEWAAIGLCAFAMVSGTLALARAGVPTLPAPPAEDTGPPLPAPAG